MRGKKSSEVKYKGLFDYRRSGLNYVPDSEPYVQEENIYSHTHLLLRGLGTAPIFVQNAFVGPVAINRPRLEGQAGVHGAGGYLRNMLTPVSMNCFWMVFHDCTSTITSRSVRGWTGGSAARSSGPTPLRLLALTTSSMLDR